MPWVTKIAAQRALGGMIRDAAGNAANGNTLISRKEQKNLPEYLQRVADDIRMQNPGTRITIDELIDAAMTDAMGTWAKFNPPNNGLDSKYLSKAEIADVKKYDNALGIMTAQARARAAGAAAPVVVDPPAPDSRLLAVTMATDHPSARLEKEGDTYKLISDSAGSEANLGHKAKATLSFDGKTLDLEAFRNGTFSLWRAQDRMPAGYWLTLTNSGYGDPRVETFKIERAAPDAKSIGELMPIARKALADYVRNERMHDGDWKIDLALPDTWEGLVAEGIMDWINRFGVDTGDDSYGRPETYDLGDHYAIAGPGPFGLHTEVAIGKVDGEVRRVYVEID